MSEYIYAAVIVCPADYRDIGNALAASVDPDVGGALTFADGHGLPCYPAGTTFSGQRPMRTPSKAPAAYATFPLLRQGGHDQIVALVASGQYPRLKVDIGDRATIEARGTDFITNDLGLVLPS